VGIKPPEILNRLPSVSELLEKPPIRALADRWNRSAVAGGVRSFLEEFTEDLRRRAADVQLPSIRDLAERAARYVASRQQQSLGTAINATGTIWGEPWIGRPLSDAATERAAATGREFIRDGNGDTADSTAATEAALCRVSGAPAAAVVHSYSGALWLALAALAQNREILVARSEVGEVAPGDSLPRLAASADVRLRDVGTTNRVSAADYEAGVSSRTAAILSMCPDEYCIVGQTGAVEPQELVSVARGHRVPLVAALGIAPLVDPPASFTWVRQSVRGALAAGFDLVIVRGDGLVGGPACGILAGSREVVGRIREHAMYRAWRLDNYRSAALATTVECHAEGERGMDSLPVWQLLTAPIENLRNRAERIAPQLAQAEGVASAAAEETRSPISPSLGGESGYPSYGVALTARDGSAASLDTKFRGLPFPVCGRVEGERLIIDLRTVMPKQDRLLVESIVNLAASANLGARSDAAAEAPPPNSPVDEINSIDAG
jgi:L-seryl-tRNA(Ser) seleniumtransferase